MLRNSKKPKSIIFTIALTTILNSYSSLAYAKTYDSGNIVKNYNELQSEVAKGLEIGATDVKIKFDGKYLKEFSATGNKGLGDLINSAKYKANNDYFANEIKKYSYGGYGNDITFTFEYLETEDETKQVDEKVKEIIKDKIKSNMSEDEKVKVIHDYIVTHVQYDSNGLAVRQEAHTAYAGLFRDKQGEPNETVCQGYALLFYKMAKEAGLDARIMTGNSFSKSANQKPQPHAWNLIKINGNWYQIDLTWDDPVMAKPDPNHVRYDYYNLSDEEMQKDHTYNDPDKFPKCINKYKDKANDEFLLKEIGRIDEDVIVASDEQELKSKLLEKIKLGQSTVKVKYKDVNTIQKVLQDLIYKDKAIITYKGFSYMQYPDGCLCTIPLKLKVSVNEIKAEKESYELELNKPDSFKIMADFSDGKQKNVTNEVKVISSDKSKVVIDKNKATILGTHKGFVKLQVIYGDKTKEINVNIVDAKKSNNANLLGITVDGEALEGFSEDKLEYSVEAKSLDNISKIDATLSDVKGKLEIVQATNLKGQENEKIALINVEAEDGTKRQYKVIFDTTKQEKLEQQKLEEQRAEEERKRIEKENKAKEEQQKKEQAEKQAQEDQKKQEAIAKQKLEEQRAEEEKQRVAKEKKAQEEKQKLEQQRAQEERQRVEKENKAKEEQQKKEQAEKQAQEDQKKQEAIAKQKLEEQRAEEEKQRVAKEKKAQEEKQKLEQQRAQEERQRVEKENKAKEEQQKKEQAEKQAQEDQKKQEAIAKQKLEEQRAEEEKQRVAKEKKTQEEKQKLEQQRAQEERQRVEKENKAKEEQQKKEQAEKQAQEDQKKQEAMAKQKLEEQRAEEEKQRVAKEKKAQEEKQKLEQQRAQEERQRVEKENKAKEEQQAKEAQHRQEAEKQKLDQQKPEEEGQKAKEQNKNVIRIQRDKHSSSRSSERSSNRESTTNSDVIAGKQHNNYHRKQVTPEQKRDIINNILSMDNICGKTEFKEEINKAIRYSNVEIWGKDRKEDKTSLDHNFVIEFNRNVNSRDLNSKIILFDKNTGERVDVNFEIGGNGRLVKINKKENFKVGRSYILFINKNLEDSFNKQRLNKVILMEINC